ncbi:phosphoglycerate kinase [Candidatus Mycosynbacter amalyticus]|uniref:Phosphoglycerate kinase n=1 Tax=Candidatus Mycosynbacter amalyticus TaxID=2665156 RepID=A0A857MPB5_9BACT|nr:phosphoglycerate kinase [Candidatus Mycosynbacter amalyticus]QHN43089.1 phosphoglycerate kinase [Candidatus Mycosynbacter amalyticus]
MSFAKLTIRDVPVHDKVVLVRADYNVPLMGGKISDDLRIRASVPTLQYLREQSCKVVVMSHLGRPDGDTKLEFSLAPVAERLSELLGVEVRFVDACYGDKVTQAVKAAKSGDVLLLENVRFHAEEEANDSTFAGKIAKSSLARYFVQDGFGVVHRAHASTEAITHFLPSVAGLLLEREVTTISHAMEDPERPLYAVMGGAKVSDKIKVIEAFVHVADKILIGGAMANTFLAYKGYDIGKSKAETDQQETLDAIYEAARAKVGEAGVDDFIMLPVDVAVAGEISPEASRRNAKVDAIGVDDIAADIGDLTIERFSHELAHAKTVVWNGTMGLAELPEFAHGSARVAMTLATTPGMTSIVGGGDTADFALKWDGNGGRSFTHVSTGGGASLDLMAGNKLPGVEALLEAKK